MTADELRQLSKAGMEVGAHTVRHLQLPALSRPEQVTEIADSRHVLERVLGTPVTALAYPYGAFDEYVIRTVGNPVIEGDDSVYFATDESAFREKWRVGGNHRDVSALAQLVQNV